MIDPVVGDVDMAFWLFLESVDPAQVELERFTRPGPGERPGSRADRVMRAGHEARREVRARLRSVGAEEWVALLEESRRYDPASGYRQKSRRLSVRRQLEIALAVEERKAS